MHRFNQPHRKKARRERALARLRVKPQNERTVAEIAVLEQRIKDAGA